MDKEFLEKVLACKTAEELRALVASRSRLSDDEAEEVTGGAMRDDVRIQGIARRDAGRILRAVAEYRGDETAAAFAGRIFGGDTDWQELLREDGHR